MPLEKESYMANFEITEDVLKETFALLTSSTDYEVSHVVDPQSTDYWQKEKLDDVLKCAQTKREYALDSLRGVLNYFQLHGYQLSTGGEAVDIKQALEQLVANAEE